MEIAKTLVVLILSLIFQGILGIPRLIALIIGFFENLLRVIKELITLCTDKIESEVLK